MMRKTRPSRRHGCVVGTTRPTYLAKRSVLPTDRLGSNSSILLAPSGANCFTSRSRVVLLSPRTAKANQTKVRICASFSTIGAHLAFEERFVRPYDRRLG